MRKISEGVWEAVSVYAKAGQAYKYCVTGPDGRYEIGAAPGDTLRFSFVGFRTAEEPVGRRTRIDVVLEAAAEAVIRIANTHMAGAIRMVSISMGADPRDFALFAFGGAGPLHAVALAKSYAGAGQYTQAITQYEWAAQQSTQRNEVAFYGYIDCLLKRNQPEYKPQLSDVEYAVELLNQSGKVIDQKTHAMLLQRAVGLLLPANILQTRATETNILADVGRGLNSLGKSLGGILGGRELHLPYSQDVIASAPQLLMDQIIVASLVHSNNMQAALKRILNPENDSTIT